MPPTKHPFPADFLDSADAALSACRAKGLILATAESCTGGMVMAALTGIAGSSDVVDRGFVTYTNEAKTQMLGVPEEMLEAHGAVSPEVARAMAEGALANSQATIAVSITGIAGPGGGSKEKPVGLVHMACALSDGLVSLRRHTFAGDRADVRHAAVNAALDLILRTLEVEDEVMATVDSGDADDGGGAPPSDDTPGGGAGPSFLS